MQIGDFATARSLANARQLYWRLHPRLTWIVTITAFAKPSIACPSLRPGATSIFRWLTAGVIPEMPKALSRIFTGAGRLQNPVSARHRFAARGAHPRIECKGRRDDAAEYRSEQRLALSKHSWLAQ